MISSPDAPVDVLPLGEQVALVRASVAPMHEAPRLSSPQISQQLAWHPVDIVSAAGDWRHVRGMDGYEGWMHTGYLAPASALGATIGEWPTRARRSLGCVVRGDGDLIRALPVGAFVHPDERIEFGRALPPEELAQECPPEPQSVIETGLRCFAGSPYLWGGTSPWGCDCSGFVQSVFSLHGIPLPRDAWQQGEVGAAGADSLLEAGAGDLLFFSDRADGRITHVGLALGGTGMAHVAVGRGGFAVEQLDNGRDVYVAGLVERFRFARRVFPSPSDGMAAA